MIFFSTLIQSLIYEFSLIFLFSSFSFSINLPFSNDIFLSTSNNNSSSLSFKAPLIFVNNFCIFNFNSSLFSFILLNNFFNSLIDSSNLLNKLSKDLILFFNLLFFSSFISFIKHISQLVCWPLPPPSILVIHAAQHNWLCVLQKYSNSILCFFSWQNPINISFSFLSKLNKLCSSNNSEWWFIHLLQRFILHSIQYLIASISKCFLNEHFLFLFSIYISKKKLIFIENSLNNFFSYLTFEKKDWKILI